MAVCTEESGLNVGVSFVGIRLKHEQIGVYMLLFAIFSRVQFNSS
jgi:hypothetical protein